MHIRITFCYEQSTKVLPQGVILAIKDSVSFQPLNIKTDCQGPYIIPAATHENAEYTIVNIYAPNKNPHHFIKKIVTKAQKMQKGQLIICRLQITDGPIYRHLQSRTHQKNVTE